VSKFDTFELFNRMGVQQQGKETFDLLSAEDIRYLQRQVAELELTPSNIDYSARMFVHPTLQLMCRLVKTLDYYRKERGIGSR
jgi:hypothetical protein